MQFLAPIIALLATSVNCFAQVITIRYCGAGLLKSVYLGFVIGLFFNSLLIVIVFTSFESTWDSVAYSIISLLTYSALSYCYFHFINLGETARRIRLIREIGSFEHAPTRVEILERYGPAHIYQKRLDRLVASKQIKLVAGRYVINRPSMYVITFVMEALKHLVFGPDRNRRKPPL
jgi:hypothetical protein